MIKGSFDRKHNALIIEFEGNVDVAQAERFYSDVKKILPKRRKGFTLLTDLSSVQNVDLKVQETIKKTMDFFNAQGVSEIIRVIPDADKDIGFNIMSIFHYSKKVKFLTVQSRQEAQARLK